MRDVQNGNSLNMENPYICSNGDKWTRMQLKKRWTEAKRGFMDKYICECCGGKKGTDPDHTISRQRCRDLHKSELILLEDNISWSCRTCHVNEWESFKNGKFQFHNNFEKRMTFVAEHDYNGFMMRVNYLTDPKKIEFCEQLMFPEEN